MAVNRRDKARECCDLVILAMYVFIPPGRGIEVRTLEIQRNWQQFHPNQVKDRNVLLLKDSEEVTLYFHNYKTAKVFGPHELTLKVRQSSSITQLTLAMGIFSLASYVAIDHGDRLTLVVLFGQEYAIALLVHVESVSIFVVVSAYFCCKVEAKA